jgi:hypothetical protein
MYLFGYNTYWNTRGFSQFLQLNDNVAVEWLAAIVIRFN